MIAKQKSAFGKRISASIRDFQCGHYIGWNEVDNNSLREAESGGSHCVQACFNVSFSLWLLQLLFSNFPKNQIFFRFNLIHLAALRNSSSRFLPPVAQFDWLLYGKEVCLSGTPPLALTDGVSTRFIVTTNLPLLSEIISFINASRLSGLLKRAGIQTVRGFWVKCLTNRIAKTSQPVISCEHFAKWLCGSRKKNIWVLKPSESNDFSLRRTPQAAVQFEKVTFTSAVRFKWSRTIETWIIQCFKQTSGSSLPFTFDSN